jgi:hypothetical protein
MADDDTKGAETREFPIEVTVGNTKVTVTLTLKSTAVVADVQTKVVTAEPGATVMTFGKPSDGR